MINQIPWIWEVEDRLVKNGWVKSNGKREWIKRVSKYVTRHIIYQQCGVDELFCFTVDLNNVLSN